MTIKWFWITITYYILIAIVPTISLNFGASPTWLPSTIFLCFILYRAVALIRSQLLRQIVLAVTTGFVVMSNSFLGASYYLQGQGFGDGFFFHMQWDTIYGLPVYWREVAGLGINLVLAIIAALWMLRVRQRKLPKPWVWVLLPLSLFLFTPILQLMQYKLERLTATPLSTSALPLSPAHDATAKLTPASLSSTSINSLQSNRAPLTLSGLSATSPAMWSADVTAGPKMPKNLIMIYLEGLEQSYFEMPELMPNLSQWRQSTIRFTNVYQVTPGSTMVGIVATQCGWPIFRVHKPGDDEGPSFLRKLRCLGDELADAGYSTTFMGGADTRFTGKRLFFKSHGFNTVLGGPELQERLSDPDYKNYWGLHDDSLFELAIIEMEQLSLKDAPFALVLLTIGTHIPGFIAASCPEYDASEHQVLRAVHCTDKLVYDFIQRIRSSPISDETVIVVLSDHLMLGGHTHGIQLGKRRLAILLDIPGEKALSMDQRGTHFDVAPTVLAALGFKFSGRIGLGSSLILGEGFLWSPEQNFKNEVQLRNFVESEEMRNFIDEQW